MASQAWAGYKGKVYVSTDGGSTYNAIGEVRESTLTISTEEIDVTSFDSNGWIENIAGLRSWEMSTEALYLYDNVGQEDLESALMAGNTVYMRVLPKSGTGNKGYEGEAIISSYEVNNTIDDAVVLSCEFLGKGELTTYTEA